MHDPKPKTSGDIKQEYLARKDFTGWFDVIYARAAEGKGSPGWAHMEAHPQLVSWAVDIDLQGAGKTALVVGCGLGDDAEFLAERGFAVTAFDISGNAIASCKKRFPNTNVDYQVMDLFKLPHSWRGKFDFVLESRTIQALPYDWHEDSIAAIASTIADAGQIVVLCFGREPEENVGGIPWALSREELAVFHAHGLIEQSFHEFAARGQRRFRVVYQKQS